jgi:hypothetical protein
MDARVHRAALVASCWAIVYAAYRAYYGLGGTVGMPGVPVSDATWRLINLVGAALLVAAAWLPLVLVRRAGDRRARAVFVVFAWVAAVGCIGHALVDDVLRLLSLAGLAQVPYPPGFWRTFDVRLADVTDLVLNEPWFLIEGLLWARIAWLLTSGSRARRWWMASAATAIVVFTVVGLLSGLGVIGRYVVL